MEGDLIYVSSCIKPQLTMPGVANRKPHAALQTLACSSMKLPKNYIFVFHFLFLLQSVENCKMVLWHVAASMLCSITFASRSKINYDVTE